MFDGLALSGDHGPDIQSANVEGIARMSKKAIASLLLAGPIVLLGLIAVRTPPAIRALNEGSEASLSGRYDEALRGYDQAIALDPKWATAHCARGDLLIKLKRYTDATGSLRECLRLEPGHFDGRTSLAMALLHGCDYAAAQVALDELDRMKPTHPRVLHNAEWVRTRLKSAAVLGGRCPKEEE